ncbi:MAG: GNAT family N-acetyltransferase [Lacisediminihabitans sp.]
MSEDYVTHPIDPESAGALASRGLRFELLGVDEAGYVPWTEAVNRGFHEARPTAEFMATRRTQAPFRRISGVWDDTIPDAASPVATASSWPTELTVPGLKSVTAWAISTITVSATHRRRGVARELLGAELRTAHALGVPVAILTASEATIYGRWGFAPAAMTATWTVDTRDSKWSGPEASGRVHYVTSEQLLVDGHEIVERMRLSVPGLIAFDGQLWERLLGIGDDTVARTMRFLRYDDAEGTPLGFAIYRVRNEDTHRGRAVAEVQYLAATTEDASAALWRFLLELDLIGELRASLRPVTEPFVWQISDFRAAVKSEEHDHLWARILDVPAALQARRYSAPGRVVLDVSDPQGFAAGKWLLEVAADGTGSVTRLDGAGAMGAEIAGAGAGAGATGTAVAGSLNHAADVVSLGVGQLSSIYLGGVSATVLARAGRITELNDGAAERLEAMFRSPVTPWLSIWF